MLPNITTVWIDADPAIVPERTRKLWAQRAGRYGWNRPSAHRLSVIPIPGSACWEVRYVPEPGDPVVLGTFSSVDVALDFGTRLSETRHPAPIVIVADSCPVGSRGAFCDLLRVELTSLRLEVPLLLRLVEPNGLLAAQAELQYLLTLTPKSAWMPKEEIVFYHPAVADEVRVASRLVAQEKREHQRRTCLLTEGRISQNEAPPFRHLRHAVLEDDEPVVWRTFAQLDALAAAGNEEAANVDVRRRLHWSFAIRSLFNLDWTHEKRSTRFELIDNVGMVLSSAIYDLTRYATNLKLLQIQIQSGGRSADLRSQLHDRLDDLLEWVTSLFADQPDGSPAPLNLAICGRNGVHAGRDGEGRKVSVRWAADCFGPNGEYRSYWCNDDLDGSKWATLRHNSVEAFCYLRKGMVRDGSTAKMGRLCIWLDSLIDYLVRLRQLVIT